MQNNEVMGDHDLERYYKNIRSHFYTQFLESPINHEKQTIYPVSNEHIDTTYLPQELKSITKKFYDHYSVNIVFNLQTGSKSICTFQNPLNHSSSYDHFETLFMNY